MPKTATLTLPWPPTVNSYYRTTMIGGAPRTLISADGREYKALVKMAVRESRAPHFGLARLGVAITAFPPDRAARDLDNILKAIFDGLSDEVESKKDAAKRGHEQRQVVQAGIWRNDAQIDELSVRRGQVVSEGRIVITVTELATFAQQLELAAPAKEASPMEPF